MPLIRRGGHSVSMRHWRRSSQRHYCSLTVALTQGPQFLNQALEMVNDITTVSFSVIFAFQKPSSAQIPLYTRSTKSSTVICRNISPPALFWLTASFNKCVRHDCSRQFLSFFIMLWFVVLYRWAIKNRWHHVILWYWVGLWKIRLINS